MSDHTFSSKEIEFLSDTSFLNSKRIILEKIKATFESCSTELDHELTMGNYAIHSDYLQIAPKISLGENYKGLPYVVLDNPRFFKKNEVFSYRILLWWGNFISFSLHLQGPAAREALNSILNRMTTENSIYYCTGSTPWQYHFEKENYMLLADLDKDTIMTHFANHGFVKIAKKATLNEWPSLNNLAIENLRKLAALTSLLRQF